MKDVKLFRWNDLPTGPGLRQYGFSLYRGVLVQWDEDYDTRLLIVIDEMPPKVRKALQVAQESQANLRLLWHHRVPKGYEEGTEIALKGDYWGVVVSRPLTEIIRHRPCTMCWRSA